MIIGAHAIVYSRQAEADRLFLRDVLGFSCIDSGGGWLIFRLPPAEVAVHPFDENDVHELYLMTDDVEALVESMRARGFKATPISKQEWGLLTRVTLPGGGKLGIYEPRHASPLLGVSRGRSKPRARPARRIPKKSGGSPTRPVRRAARIAP